MSLPASAAAAPSAAVRRHRFHAPGASPAQAAQAQERLCLLLAQDGSTTRLCEALAGGPVQLVLHYQERVAPVPPVVQSLLPGAQFIERCTSLCAQGEVMMDNLTYVALDRLSSELREGLAAGTLPIGHLLATLWVRRSAVEAARAAPLYERLWQHVGLADAPASRAYTIYSEQGPLFLIAETYRGGMRRHGTGGPAGSAA